MSRLSISRRLQALLEAAERIDPQAAAVHKMKPATRLRYDNWRVQCDQITDEMGGGEALYLAYLDTGVSPLPAPPMAVAEALGIGTCPILTDDMSVADMAESYAAMIAN